MKLLTNIEHHDDNFDFPEKVIFVLETDIKKIIKIANKNKINRIYFKNISEEFALIKINREWKTVSKFILNLTFIKKNNLYFDSKFKIFDEINYSENFDVTFKNNTFVYDNAILETEQKLSLLIEENFWKELYKENCVSIKTTTLDKSKNLSVESFMELQIKKKNIDGIGEINISKFGNYYKIWTKNGKAFVYREDEMENEWKIITIGDREKFSDSIYYSNGFLISLKNNIEKNYVDFNKISKKNILLSVFSFVIVILLVFVTFSKIFNTGSLNSSFEILFDKFTWKQIWVYILFINFFTTLFLSFILAFFIDVVIGKKKFDIKRIFNYFLSMQIKNISLFLTGNMFISMFIWGLYLNKTSQIRISSLVATVGVANIIKTFALLFNMFIYMIPATVFLWNAFDSTSQLLFILTFSYGGFFYSISQDLLIGSLIFFPILHPIYVKMKVSIMSKKSSYFNSLEKSNADLEALSFSMRSALKDKKRVSRLVIATLLLTFFEAIETVSVFQMVENYGNHYYGNNVFFVNTGFAKYTNILSIAGCRMMSTNVRHFPLINIIPGQGVGITDYFMKHINELIIAKEHGISINEYSEYHEYISEMSMQSAFITRFFNFYLNKIIALTLTTTTVIKIIISRHNKRSLNAKKY